jgi:hypothetical protein
VVPAETDAAEAGSVEAGTTCCAVRVVPWPDPW